MYDVTCVWSNRKKFCGKQPSGVTALMMTYAKSVTFDDVHTHTHTLPHTQIINLFLHLHLIVLPFHVITVSSCSRKATGVCFVERSDALDQTSTTQNARRNRFSPKTRCRFYDATGSTEAIDHSRVSTTRFEHASAHHNCKPHSSSHTLVAHVERCVVTHPCIMDCTLIQAPRIHILIWSFPSACRHTHQRMTRWTDTSMSEVCTVTEWCTF
jgi:hypothetical protein